MWIVVHFLNDDAVEAVPETWYRKKDKTCAWPLSKNNTKKHIEKKDYPNINDFMWLPARSLGRKYGNYLENKYKFVYIFNCKIIYTIATLEEARNKSKIAQFMSDLSANEESAHKKKVNSIESPPSLKHSNFILYFNSIF